MKRLAADLAILIGGGIAITLLFAVLYPAIGLPATGPVPLRTIVLVGVATILIRKSRRTWAHYGLMQPLRWWQLLLAIVILFAAKLLLAQPLSDWLRTTLQLAPNDYSFFRQLEGSFPALFAWLLVAWIAGAFAEEMLLRGYVMGRVAESLGSRRAAWAVAVIVQALIFGVGHAYAGMGGAVSATITALLYGAAVLLSKRSLWPAIIVHGLWDSLGFYVLYSRGVAA